METRQIVLEQQKEKMNKVG